MKLQFFMGSIILLIFVIKLIPYENPHYRHQTDQSTNVKPEPERSHTTVD